MDVGNLGLNDPCALLASFLMKVVFRTYTADGAVGLSFGIALNVELRPVADLAVIVLV